MEEHHKISEEYRIPENPELENREGGSFRYLPSITQSVIPSNVIVEKTRDGLIIEQTPVKRLIYSMFGALIASSTILADAALYSWTFYDDIGVWGIIWRLGSVGMLCFLFLHLWLEYLFQRSKVIIDNDNLIVYNRRVPDLFPVQEKQFLNLWEISKIEILKPESSSYFHFYIETTKNERKLIFIALGDDFEDIFHFYVLQEQLKQYGEQQDLNFTIELDERYQQQVLEKSKDLMAEMEEIPEETTNEIYKEIEDALVYVQIEEDIKELSIEEAPKSWTILIALVLVFGGAVFYGINVYISRILEYFETPFIGLEVSWWWAYGWIVVAVAFMGASFPSLFSDFVKTHLRLVKDQGLTIEHTFLGISLSKKEIPLTEIKEFYVRKGLYLQTSNSTLPVFRSSDIKHPKYYSYLEYRMEQFMKKTYIPKE